MHSPVYEESHHGHQIIIYHDADPQNPREGDCFGTMICRHRRYNLGDDHDFHNAREFLTDLVSCCDETELPNDRLLEMAQTKAVILPVYLFDHSGLAMNTTGFHCSWDSGQVGFIYVRLEDVRQAFNITRVSKQTRKRAEDALRCEIAAYHDYISGNTYGYTVEYEGEIIDSCWDFGGDFDGYCLSEARKAVSQQASQLPSENPSMQASPA